MLNRRSEWRRWEPHIHAPGAVLNNQFGSGELVALKAIHTESHGVA